MAALDGPGALCVGLHQLGEPAAPPAGGATEEQPVAGCDGGLPGGEERFGVAVEGDDTADTLRRDCSRVEPEGGRQLVFVVVEPVVPSFGEHAAHHDEPVRFDDRHRWQPPAGAGPRPCPEHEDQGGMGVSAPTRTRDAGRLTEDGIHLRRVVGGLGWAAPEAAALHFEGQAVRFPQSVEVGGHRGQRALRRPTLVEDGEERFDGGAVEHGVEAHWAALVVDPGGQVGAGPQQVPGPSGRLRAGCFDRSADEVDHDVPTVLGQPGRPEPGDGAGHLC